MTSATLPDAIAKDRDAYSIAELAARLGVHSDTVRDEISRGKLRIVRFGRRVLIPMAEVQRILSTNGKAVEA